MSMRLEDSISSAFQGVPPPEDDRIALHECDECRSIRDDLRRVAWDALSEEVLERRCDSLPLLSPEAFRYFVPAYMRYSLRHPDSEVAFFTGMGLGVRGLYPGDLERFRIFSSAEQAVVITFLEFLRARFDDIDPSDPREARHHQEIADVAITTWRGLS